MDMVNFFSNVSLGLNDEKALEAIESTFKQFNTFLDLMQERGYVTIWMLDNATWHNVFER